MKRHKAIEAILKYLYNTDIALFTAGMISREAFLAGDRKNNFYILGSMGLVSSIGLGIALNTKKRVVIIDGDGSILMNMGVMAMIGASRPTNLVHIVLDNEAYDSTGGQPSISDTARLEQVARDVGYSRSVKVDTAIGLKKALRGPGNVASPYFLLVKVEKRADKNPARVKISPPSMRKRLMESLACRRK